MVRARGNHVGPDSNLFVFFVVFFCNWKSNFRLVHLSSLIMTPGCARQIGDSSPHLSDHNLGFALRERRAGAVVLLQKRGGVGARTPRVSPDSNNVVSPIRGGYNPHCYRTAG